MDALVKKRVVNEVEQLSNLLDAAERLLTESLSQLEARVESHQHALGEVGDARDRARLVSDGVGRKLEECAQGVRRAVEALPQLAAATEPMRADMQAMTELLQKLDGLASTTLLNALNASAAAERAGAAGAAFGVVAQEVAALPPQANEISSAVRKAIAVTTEHLGQMSKDLQQRATVGSAAVAQASQRTGELAAKIQAHGLHAFNDLLSSTDARKRTQKALQRSQRALRQFNAGRVQIQELRKIVG